MMTEKQKSRVLELKAMIAATPSGAAREVRDAVLVLKQEIRRAGGTARELAAALGLHETTLCRWEHEGRPTQRGRGRPTSRRASAAESRFRVVQLAAPDSGSSPSTPAAVSVSTVRALRVAHAPSGLVIDGLDIETLAMLLRRMS
jgi:hypothetical protein